MVVFWQKEKVEQQGSCFFTVTQVVNRLRYVGLKLTALHKDPPAYRRSSGSQLERERSCWLTGWVSLQLGAAGVIM